MGKFTLLTTLTLSAAGFNKGIDGAKRQSKALSDGVKAAGSTMAGAFAPLTGIMGGLTGQLGALGSVAAGGVTAFKSMIPAINGIKTALISSGIGIIVVALGTAFSALMSYMKGTTEGAMKMQLVMGYIKGAFNAILVRVQLLGEAVSLVFEGKFKQAGEKLKEAFKGGLLQEIKDDAKEAVGYAERENKLWRTKLDFKLEEVKLENRLKDLKLIIGNNDVSAVDRQKALVEAQGIVNTLGEKRVAIATEEFNILKSKNAMGNNSREDTEKEVDLQVQITTEKNKQLDGQKELLEKQNLISAKLKTDLDNLKKETTLLPEISLEHLMPKKLDTTKLVDMEGLEIPPAVLNGWSELGALIYDADLKTSLFMTGIQSMTGIFEDMFEGTKGAFKSMVTAMLEGIKTIIDGLLAQAIAAMIAKESTKGLFGLVTASVGIAALTALWKTKVKEFASGGISQGGLALVGERGPELVNLPSGSRVFNNLESQQMLGGGDVTFRIEDTQLVGILNNYNRRKNSYR